jgi:hypothetical protein
VDLDFSKLEWREIEQATETKRKAAITHRLGMLTNLYLEEVRPRIRVMVSVEAE